MDGGRRVGPATSKGNAMPGAETGAIGWGTLMLINAGLAQTKDRSGLNWWLISLLLGPLATFLIVVLPPPEGEVGPGSSTTW